RPEANLIFRVQTTFEHALRTYWVEHDFIELHTPKLMASASESKAELFEVGPAFRADPSFTSRHATEFTSVDSEVSWIDSHEDVMNLHEELLVAGFQAVKDKHGAEIEAAFGVEVTVPTTPF